ncbi:hypothetical protein RhiirC2_787643 [Rhizophagus irregularis]|uniref:RNI-like protein n=1 Tax=Rhizophagus irregularis TaxID=588596 RepID=A0A2N1MRT7_9GLOM|nr:hypothetical protein RhiirC2_787643 [Rhizophagus irregularis]
MSLVQGKNTVKNVYSKLKECNKSFGHSKEFLKYVLLKGLLSKNKIKVCIDGLEVLVLDEIVERISLEHSFAENNEGLYAIVNSYHKLECLNISKCTEFSETSICNIIRFCSKLQHLSLSFCKTTDIVTIKEIAGSCFNLKYLNLEGCSTLSNNGVLDVIHELARHLGIPHDALRDVASLDNFIYDKLSRRLSKRCILARPSL